MKRASICVATAATLLSAMCSSGCSPTRPRVTDTPQQQEQQAFEEGAKRPPTARTMYAMAVLLASQRKDSDCEWVLKRIITEYPEFTPAYCELAELQVRQQRIDDAMTSLIAGLASAPGDATLTNNLGMCWLVKGDARKAMDLFTRAAGAEPYNARYRANVATALGMLGRYEESQALYEQVVTPKEAERNVNTLRTLALAKERAEAQTSENK